MPDNDKRYDRHRGPRDRTSVPATAIAKRSPTSSANNT